MIWCVEDDASIRDIEVYALQSMGFEARGFSDGKSFWEALTEARLQSASSEAPPMKEGQNSSSLMKEGQKSLSPMKERPELVALDIMLPEMDGIEILGKMKADPNLCDIPVILATAKGEEYDKVQGLDLGADYYLVKPFGVMEFVSCVRAVLRRCQPNRVDHLLQTGDLIVNLDEHTVTVEGRRVMLTLKEFELLRLFLSHPGMAYTRDQLFQDIWGMDYCGETRTVDMHIRTLRQKLGLYGERIETVRGVGYRLEAEQ